MKFDKAVRSAANNFSRHSRTFRIAASLCAATVTAAQADCFSISNPKLPTIATITPTLTNGAEGLAIVQAVRDGSFVSLETLARANPELLSTRTVLPEGTRPSNGNTADLLSIAVTSCNPQMVGALLELGADPNGAIPGLALTYAALSDDPIMAVVLLQGGANPDAKTENTATALREALYYKRSDAVAVLANFGADVNRAELFGHTPLLAAITFGDWKAAKVLMDAGANPWQVSNKGKLPAFEIWKSSGLRGHDGEIHEELLARAKDRAPIWPPPPPEDVARNVHSGEWPTTPMKQGGFSITEGAMRSIQMISR